MPILAALAAGVIWAGVSSAVSNPRSQAAPLAPFERLIGGRWHYNGGYQEFSWGVGKELVRSRNFSVVDGQVRLVAEGMWYWHPGEKAVRGTFIAIDMPVVLFDYAARFEGDTMKNILRSYDGSGAETINEETWQFTDDHTYVWTLYRRTEAGLEKEMGVTFSRKR